MIRKPPAGWITLSTIRSSVPGQVIHLLRATDPERSSARYTRCGLSRFDTQIGDTRQKADIPGWSLRGNLGVTPVVYCPGCWDDAAPRPMEALWRSTCTAHARYNRDCRSCNNGNWHDPSPRNVDVFDGENSTGTAKGVWVAIDGSLVWGHVSTEGPLTAAAVRELVDLLGGDTP